VIASDLPVLREVGGSAASYCAVGDIEDWTQAVVSAIQNRNFTRERAFANAARFSWSENATQTARVYEQVLGKG
jgi:glycosyltransferase involved in cell wall biosynthesis